MIVFDSSTLILPAKTEILTRVLEDTQIVITDTVKEESTGRQEFIDAKLITRFVNEGKIKVENYDIGKEGRKIKKDFNMEIGEVSSLLLARKRGYILATDDKQAIKACKILQIPFLTAIHFLLRLYEKEVIGYELAFAKVKILERVGRYHPDIIRDVLRKIGEGR